TTSRPRPTSATISEKPRTTPARCGSVRAKPNFTPEVISIKLFGPGLAAAATPNATKPARTSRWTCKAEASGQLGRGGDACARRPSVPARRDTAAANESRHGDRQDSPNRAPFGKRVSLAGYRAGTQLASVVSPMRQRRPGRASAYAP